MERFTRDEVERAFKSYWRVGAFDERWSEWGRVFTPDVHYVEHIYGTMRGREAVQAWISKLMVGPNLHVHAFLDWYMIENQRVVVNMTNRYYNPDPDGAPFDFPGITILEYAGDGLFRYEEDYWDLRLAKRAYEGFMTATKGMDLDGLKESPEQRRLRNPWPDDSSF
ncbi:MAG: nuclear transport factor 2 family protein [Myxococcales bacterium]|nr:nuclear transport factor 2 family protein [Myxococcales bacterium]